jgi:hypothetical protein
VRLKLHSSLACCGTIGCNLGTSRAWMTEWRFLCKILSFTKFFLAKLCLHVPHEILLHKSIFQSGMQTNRQKDRWCIYESFEFIVYRAYRKYWVYLDLWRIMYSSFCDQVCLMKKCNDFLFVFFCLFSLIDFVCFLFTRYLLKEIKLLNTNSSWKLFSELFYANFEGN